MNEKNLDFFETIAPERDTWKKKNSYYWEDVEKLCSFLIPESASVLEIGCGTGDLLAYIQAKKKVGIDYSRNMIAIARRKYPDINFMQMEAEHLNFKETFDYVILSNLIGYLEDIQKVFGELKKVCHPHSKIIVTYYNFLWQPVLRRGCKLNLRMKQPQQNWLSKQDIKNLLYLAGFDAFKEGERLLLPINIPLVSETFNRYIAKLPLLRKLCITNYVIAKPFQIESNCRERYSVSVIIPARNESGNIENAILRTPRMGRHTEIILIEGNSQDNTWEKIQEVHEKYKLQYDIKIAQRRTARGKAMLSERDSIWPPVTY